MTNKDTERRVRQAMQQTIPDKDALWSRIESNLPAQQEFPPIRKSAGRHIVRIVGAAACFLLVIGGVGVWSALGGHMSSKMETTNEAAMPQNADAPADDAAGENAAAEREYAADEAPRDIVNGHQSVSHGKNAMGDAAKDDADAACDAAAEAPVQEDVLPLNGFIHGEPCVIPADEALLTEARDVIGEGQALQEMISDETLGRARKEGVLLTFELDGEEVTLMALDGEYRMIAGEQVYPASEAAQRLLESLA